MSKLVESEVERIVDETVARLICEAQSVEYGLSNVDAAPIIREAIHAALLRAGGSGEPVAFIDAAGREMLKRGLRCFVQPERFGDFDQPLYPGQPSSPSRVEETEALLKRAGEVGFMIGAFLRNQAGQPTIGIGRASLDRAHKMICELSAALSVAAPAAHPESGRQHMEICLHRPCCRFRPVAPKSNVCVCRSLEHEHAAPARQEGSRLEELCDEICAVFLRGAVFHDDARTKVLAILRERLRAEGAS